MRAVTDGERDRSHRRATTTKKRLEVDKARPHRARQQATHFRAVHPDGSSELFLREAVRFQAQAHDPCRLVLDACRASHRIRIVRARPLRRIVATKPPELWHIFTRAGPHIHNSLHLCAFSLHAKSIVAKKTIQFCTAHYRGMDDITQLIDNYTPRALETEMWEEAAPFVRAAIRRYSIGRTKRNVEAALSTLSAFADWVLFTGVSDASDTALRANIIDAYAHHRRTEVEAPLAERERKRLRLIAGLRNTPEKRDIATTATATEPLSAPELDNIRRWAQWQSRDVQRRTASTIAALGLGCGLTATEMMSVRARDIITLDDGLVGVQLDDRTVPVLEEWNDELATARIADPDDYVIAPKGKVRNSYGLKGALHLLGPESPSPQRMRVTWLLGHVEASTNIFTLMSAAGLTAPDFLRRLAPYATYTPASQQLAAFRLSSEVAR